MHVYEFILLSFLITTNCAVLIIGGYTSAKQVLRSKNCLNNGKKMTAFNLKHNQ